MKNGQTKITAADFFPEQQTFEAYREAARSCRGCDLWENATQTVFGEGPRRARIMFIGEQPGNDEDLEGAPFVGPAGRILDEALEKAGIDREITYVTNVVKHFKWVPKGKLRLHKTPNTTEIRSCLPWLKAEIEFVQPEVLVCLGATAAKALIGKDFKVTQQRRELLQSDLAPWITATVHPSSILRSRSSEDRRAAMEAFIQDLTHIATHVLNGK